ncbi:hypothetical protein BKA70DRAFT_1262625 [Coprinopsis sp. MPI-PUGE-AT-0042]|nr:hypothetical protein BKA70DRAFT_1262625 [Coprinopsis sp. MPI-PUGE-AT-0042]
MYGFLLFCSSLIITGVPDGFVPDLHIIQTQPYEGVQVTPSAEAARKSEKTKTVSLPLGEYPALVHSFGPVCEMMESIRVLCRLFAVDPVVRTQKYFLGKWGERDGVCRNQVIGKGRPGDW